MITNICRSTVCLHQALTIADIIYNNGWKINSIRRYCTDAIGPIVKSPANLIKLIKQALRFFLCIGFNKYSKIFHHSLGLSFLLQPPNPVPIYLFVWVLSQCSYANSTTTATYNVLSRLVTLLFSNNSSSIIYKHPWLVHLLISFIVNTD
jgi:hypothetical protein